MVTESSNDDAAKVDGESAESARTRRTRPYPVSPFEDALSLGEAIMQYASGEKVRRLTLIQTYREKLVTKQGRPLMILKASEIQSVYFIRTSINRVHLEG